MDNKKEISSKVKIRKKWYIKLLIFIVFVCMILLLLGYLFPGLIWSRSLGVSYTKEDYASIMDKLEYITDKAPNGNLEDYDYKYGELKEVDVEFTGEELTAFFNENRPDYFAVKNVEIKINDDGTIEASGSANVDYILENLLVGRFTRNQIKKEIPALGILPNNVNLYFKVKGSITDNKSTIGIESVSVQGISIPSYIYGSNEAKITITSGINKMMTDFITKTGSDFKKIYVENGRIKFNAKIFSSLERIKR